MPRQKRPMHLSLAKARHEGIAATEAANSAVSGANLIPVLSLGIPGNAAAVFLILATETIGGFNPGHRCSVSPPTWSTPNLWSPLAFTCMTIANLFNWTIGGVFMRSMGFMIRIPKQLLLPSVLLLTLTAIYVQETRLEAIWFALGFGVLGYFMRVLANLAAALCHRIHPWQILEETARQAYSATGNDPFFLSEQPNRPSLYPDVRRRDIFLRDAKLRKPRHEQTKHPTDFVRPAPRRLHGVQRAQHQNAASGPVGGETAQCLTPASRLRWSASPRVPRSLQGSCAAPTACMTTASICRRDWRKRVWRVNGSGRLSDKLFRQGAFFDLSHL